MDWPATRRSLIPRNSTVLFSIHFVPVKPETRFYRRVNAKLTLDVHRQKISSLYGNGTADFWYSGFKADAWIEYKWLERLSRNGVDPTKLLSSLQLHWINNRYKEGRIVYVVIGSPQGCAILEDGAWNASAPVSAFRYTISDVADFISERLHDSDSASRARGSSH